MPGKGICCGKSNLCWCRQHLQTERYLRDICSPSNAVDRKCSCRVASTTGLQKRSIDDTVRQFEIKEEVIKIVMMIMMMMMMTMAEEFG